MDFSIFRVLDFWIVGFSHSGSLDLWISGRQDLYFRVPQVPGLDNATIHICTIYIYIYIYIYTYVHEHTLLAKPGFCSGGRISCKPNTGALLSTSINKMMIVKVLLIVHCLVPILIATMIVK